jgi:hypothetical protein
MAVRSGPGRALRAVRLSEVPEQLRLRALDSLLRTPGTKDGMLVPSYSLTDRLALGAAAHRPSDKVYWVSEKAYSKVMKS